MFFINDVATTDVDTYGHTLSRHDSRPIYAAGHRPCRQAARHLRHGADRPGGGTPRPRLRHDHPLRSEEHTSALQSLMRISYAAFWLKTKKYTPNILAAFSIINILFYLHQ